MRKCFALKLALCLYVHVNDDDLFSECWSVRRDHSDTPPVIRMRSEENEESKRQLEVLTSIFKDEDGRALFTTDGSIMFVLVFLYILLIDSLKKQNKHWDVSSSSFYVFPFYCGEIVSPSPHLLQCKTLITHTALPIWAKCMWRALQYIFWAADVCAIALKPSLAPR